ncbi:MAG: RNA helicase [Bacteroidales bacterium]|mgnify:CR=1 FL=1|nr:RNA helicase [Bacteroidales bacterium]
MEKKTLKIMLDFIAGPIWGYRYEEDEKKYTCGIPVLDDDEELISLHEEIQDLYSSYYHFDYNDLPCYFDEEQEKKDKGKMLSLFKRLLDRIHKLNDGSFVVEDLETERIRNL